MAGEIPVDVKACLRADDAPGLLREVERGSLDVDALYFYSGGRALLHDACARGATSCCRALLDLDASPNIQAHGKDAHGETPMHLACEMEKEDCLTALLSSPKVRLDVKDELGRTALHIAAKKNSQSCVQALLQAGADPTLEDKQKRTARKYADEKHAKEAVAAIDDHVLNQAQSAMQVDAARTSPYSPVLDETEYGELTKNLPRALYDQINYMILEGRLHSKDVDNEVKSILSGMSPTCSLAAIKEYDHRVIMDGSRYVGPLVPFLWNSPDPSRVFRGTWDDLMPGKPFGFIKDHRGRRIWTHQKQVDTEDIRPGAEVEFQKQTGRNGKEEAVEVRRFIPGSRKRATELLCCTAGGGTVPSQLLLMTVDEGRVMYDMGRTTRSDGIPLDAPQQDKVFDVPETTNGLPEHFFDTEAFYVDGMQKEASRLNSIKDKLDEKEIQVWKAHTRKTLISGVDAVNEVRDKYGAEMGTRAWLKMYEMIAAFDLIDYQVVQGGVCNSLHLCEAPGAFICATNHYISTRWPNMRWNWMGCTLNPYFEGGDTDAMVEDDAFINETRDNWYFGRDNSGDMRLQDNIRGTWERARMTMGPVHLVTADGSIDCSGTPNQQEEVVAQLHFCEAVGAMGALAKGGAFVLKMFTLFEHSSICLLYILKCFFKTVTVNKPIMSTPGNGETYVISKGFKGISQEHLQQLLDHCGTQWPTRESDGAVLSLVSREHIGNSWLASLQEGAAYFGRLQGSVITRNLRLFENSFSSADGQAVRVARQLVVGEWVRRFRIVRIDPARKIVAHSKLAGRGGTNRIGGDGWNKRKEGGNLEQRKRSREERNEIKAPELESKAKRLTIHSISTSGSSTPAIGATGGSHAFEPSGPGSSPPGADAEPELSFAQRMMAKMGYKEGGGLGKDEQGRINPITASDKTPGNRGGIAYGASEEIEASQMVHVEPRSVIVFRQPRELDGEASLGILQTGRKLQEYQMSKFCRSDIVLELLKQRRDPPADQRACWACYSVGKDLGFASRAALKLADIQGVCGELWGVEAASILLDPSGGGPVRFADLHGGRGGFSDYMLWRFGDRVRNSVLVHRQAPLHAGILDGHRTGKPHAMPESFKAPPKEGQLEIFPRGGEGAEMDPASLEGVEELVKQVLVGESQEGVLVVFGDGVCKQPAGARSSEPQSASTLWCQVLATLKILERDGSFICGITDTLGRPTIGAVYLLTHCFEKVTIIKPAMTSPSKSERYLVCIGFRGRFDPGVEMAATRLEKALKMDRSVYDVMDLVDSRLLLEQPFIGDMMKINEKATSQEAKALKVLREFVQDNSSYGEGPLPMDEEDMANQMARLGFGPPSLEVDVEGAASEFGPSGLEVVVERGPSVEGATSRASTA